MAKCCCLALADLRRRRLLHRDVKPSNILIDHRGQVKLSDFGIMREFGVPEASLSDTFTGTLAFMSPERLLAGSRSSGGLGDLGRDGENTSASEGPHTASGYSYPADIWGLGLSILALALGRNPVTRARTVWDVLAAQVGISCRFSYLGSFFVCTSLLLTSVLGCFNRMKVLREFHLCGTREKRLKEVRPLSRLISAILSIAASEGRKSPSYEPTCEI